jgi:putative two-component system response regulator
MTQSKHIEPPFILVVDDVTANAQLLVRMLTDRGYHAHAVISGELALLAARTNPPALILLDINMPHMNGFEVCEQLKADPALCEIPVIFISALHEEVDKVRAFAVGGVDYVTKPFELNEVHARVATHLKLCSLQVSV